MGTNYYLRYNECASCHRYDELHIGKQSSGWEFLFQAHKALEEGDVSTVTLEEWRSLIDKGRILDEYGKELTKEEFWKIVELHEHERKPEGDFWSEGYVFSFSEFE